MKKHVSKVCKGDERMQAIRKTLNELGYERSKMQRQFHDRFIQAVALHLYKDDPDVDLESIMRMNGWNDLRQSVLCLTPSSFRQDNSRRDVRGSSRNVCASLNSVPFPRAPCLAEAIGN